MRTNIYYFISLLICVFAGIDKVDAQQHTKSDTIIIEYTQDTIILSFVSDSVVILHKNKEAEWNAISLLDIKNKARKAIDSVKISAYDYDVDLDDLDELKAIDHRSEIEKDLCKLTGIATRTSLKLRNTPNVMTIINRKEIMMSGATDLIDILRLVPGFHFALDQKGTVGLGIRGNWANNGGVLMMIDGQEINDLFLAKVFFGNHFPVDLIEQIEIVRGPGSAIYGGFAEFGVINIVTRRSNENDQEFYAGYTRSNTKTIKANRQYRMHWAKNKNRKSIAVSLFWGNGQRSDRNNFAFYPQYQHDSLGLGAYLPLSNNSDLKPLMINTKYSNRNFHFRNIYDYYRVTNIEKTAANGNRPWVVGNQMNFTEVKYNWKAAKGLTITPRINTIIQSTKNKGYDELDSRLHAHENLILRLKGNITMNYDIDHRKNIVIGVEYFNDFYNKDMISMENRILPDNRKPVNYHNVAAFTQSILKLPANFNITAGVRYDWNSSYGHDFVPRLGFTKKFSNLHFKFLMSRAYRAPSIGNVIHSFTGKYTFNYDTTQIEDITRDIKPEQTTVIEMEAGYQLNDRMYCSANVFDITIRNPIAYYFYQDPALTGQLAENIALTYPGFTGFYVYQNFEQGGTQGFELDFQFKDSWGYANMNYSFYTAQNKEKIPYNAARIFDEQTNSYTMTDQKALLAFPNHKINLNLYFYVFEDFSINFSSTWFGKRWSYKIDYTNTNPEIFLSQSESTMLSNLFIHWENFIIHGFNLGFGLMNIFDKKYEFLQPYYGTNVTLPNLTRTATFKISYDFSLQKSKKRWKKRIRNIIEEIDDVEGIEEIEELELD